VIFEPDASITIQSKTMVAGGAVTLRVAGAQSSSISAELPQAQRTIYQGNALGGYHAQATYGRLRYRAIFSGVDLIFRLRGTTLEYDFEIAPGTNPEVIRLRFTQPARIDKDGGLRIHGAGGEILQTRPVSFQTALNGSTESVTARYRKWPDGSVSFALGKFDPRLPLTIDPAILFGSYLGGSGFDRINAVGTDVLNNIYVGGDTESLDFPPATGSSGQFRASTDAFVVKLDPSGRFLGSVILGGSGYDSVSSIALDASGNVFVTGVTSSPDFPITSGAFQTHSASPGIEDAFVVKLSPALSLIYSTYLGGASSDRGSAIAVDGAGAAYVSGSTNSVNFPTTSGAFQQSFHGGLSDCFVAKLNAAGSALMYSTLLGGEGLDACTGVAVDSAEEVIVAGTTSSTLFPVQSAIQSVLSGTNNVFVTKLAQDGTHLLFSTYLGGTNSDEGSVVRLDANSNIYVAGATASADFPVSAGAYQTTLRGVYDAFLCKIAGDGSKILFSTLLGGSGSEFITDLFINGSGQAVVSGYTSSNDFPLQNAVQAAAGGGLDGFAAVFDASAATLTFSTYIGGGGDDRANGIASTGVASLVVAGQTLSGSISYLQYLYSTTPAGQYDGFVLALPYGPIPTLASFSPVSGSGSSQVFTEVLSDSLGGGDILEAQALMNSTLAGAQSCSFEYDRASNQLHLLNDAGNAWLSNGISPGSGSVSNSQCTLQGAGSGITMTGNQLVLAYNIQFQSSFAGPKNIWTQAASAASGMGSPWQAAIVNGSPVSWTVSAPLPPPTAVSVSPGSGSGASQTFAATYSDSGGASAISAAYIVIASSLTSVGSCWIQFNAGNNTYQLVNDAGTAWSAPVSIGSGSAGNSQCTLSGAGAGATPSGNNLTVNFPVTFAAGYAGSQNIYLDVIDGGGPSSGWQQLGTFTITSGGSGPSGPVPVCNPQGFPCVVSLTPTNGSGLSGTFTGVFTHSGGATQHYLGYILFLPTPNIVQYTATGSCLVEYNRISNAMRLINDAGTNWLPGIIGLPIGKVGSLTNSHCTLNVGQSSAVINGTIMTVTAAMMFNPGFGGELATFMQAFDVTGAYTGMTQFGNWVATASFQKPGPYIVDMTPTSGTGSSATLTFTAGHTSGVSSLSFVTMLVSPVIVGAPACQAFYFPASNTLNLVNDSGSAMVSANGIVPGTAGTLSNSRCSINTGSASSSPAGNNVTVALPMTFNPSTFGGAKNIYLNAFDDFGKLSHWVTSATWTVQ